MVSESNEVTRGYAEVHGARLAYEIQGAGPDVVLVHAGIADRRMWGAQVTALAPRYRVIRYDARGFGDSVQPEGRFSRSGDLAALLGALGVTRAALVGASMGGATSLDFTLEHPEMVAGLALVAPSIGGRTPPAFLQAYWDEEDAAIARGDLDAATEVNLRLWVDGLRRTPEQVDQAVRAQVAAMQRHAYDVARDDAEEQRLDPPAITRLAEMRAPVLVLTGDLDLPDKLAVADELVAAISGARQQVIPGGAHMVNMERPAAFNAALLAFLDRLPWTADRPDRADPPGQAVRLQ